MTQHPWGWVAFSTSGAPQLNESMVDESILALILYAKMLGESEVGGIFGWIFIHPASWWQTMQTCGCRWLPRITATWWPNWAQKGHSEVNTLAIRMNLASMQDGMGTSKTMKRLRGCKWMHTHYITGNLSEFSFVVTCWKSVVDVSGCICLVYMKTNELAE